MDSLITALTFATTQLTLLTSDGSKAPAVRLLSVVDSGLRGGPIAIDVDQFHNTIACMHNVVSREE